MKKIEIILKGLLEIATLDNFIINDGTLYLLTPNTVSISTCFDAEGNVEYAEVYNIEKEDICTTSEIRQLSYAFKTITIVTEDYKITLTSSGCNMIAF